MGSITRLIAASSITAIVGFVGSASADSSSAPAAHRGGDAARAITGYAVGAVEYGLSAGDPTLVDSVSFSLDSTPSPGSSIRIQIAADGSWYSCTSSGPSVTCPTVDDAATETDEQATVSGATSLRVVISD